MRRVKTFGLVLILALTASLATAQDDDVPVTDDDSVVQENDDSQLTTEEYEALLRMIEEDGQVPDYLNEDLEDGDDEEYYVNDEEDGDGATDGSPEAAHDGSAREYKELKNIDIRDDTGEFRLVHGGTLDIEELKVVCDMDPDCKGFTNSGWLYSDTRDRVSSTSTTLYVPLSEAVDSVDRLISIEIEVEGTADDNPYVATYDATMLSAQWGKKPVHVEKAEKAEAAKARKEAKENPPPPPEPQVVTEEPADASPVVEEEEKREEGEPSVAHNIMTSLGIVSTASSKEASEEVKEKEEEIPAQRNYVLFSGMDSPFNDIKNANTKDPEALKKACDETPECIGFNTDGWLKSNTDEREENSRNSLYTTKPLESPEAFFARREYFKNSAFWTAITPQNAMHLVQAVRKPFFLMMLCDCPRDQPFVDALPKFENQVKWSDSKNSFTMGYLYPPLIQKFSLHHVFSTKQENLPYIAIDNIPMGSNIEKFIFKYDEIKDINSDALFHWQRGFWDNNIPLLVRSDPSQKVPEWSKESGKIRDLTSHNFKEVIMNGAETVFLLVYSPHCGGSIAVTPLVQQLAQQYKNNPEILIARMDHTRNDFPIRGLKLYSYPTVFLFPRHDKRYPLDFADYNGSKTPHNRFVPHSHFTKAQMVSFIEEHHHQGEGTGKIDHGNSGLHTSTPHEIIDAEHTHAHSHRH